MRGIHLVLAAIALTGCAGFAHPYIVSQTPASISLQYGGFAYSAQDATNYAQQHCAAYGKSAELIEMRSGEVSRVSFRCVNP